MNELPGPKYNGLLKHLEEWAAEDDWTYQGIASPSVNPEYEHSSGGRVQLYLEENDREEIEGIIYRGFEPGQNFITNKVDHEYLSDIEVNDPELDPVKKISIPQDYDDESLEQMLSRVTEIFEGPDYNLSDITR